MTIAMIVVDASLLIDAFLGNEVVAAALKDRVLHAPVSIDAEVVHGLRHGWFAGTLSAEDGAIVIALLRGLPIIRHSVYPFIERMWAMRRNVSAYDASYVALAESMGIPLLTRDARLSRSSGHAAAIEYIA
jgi:predicted nucleic acid-binding protein